MRRLLSSVTVAVLAAGLLTATTTTVQARAFDEQQRLDRIATPTIDWQACDEGAPAGFECASVQVPTDYDRPRGATTTVALTRLPASRPSSRKGSLFLNFGGPGGEGVSTLQQVFDVLVTPEVREHYDLVGFDPRGVGLSDPARCFDDADAEAAALEGLPAFPVTRSGERAFVRQTARISRACRAEAGDVIRHASTANVARDLELLRRAVGDDTLAYQGYSYGTYLGATYARLFPDRVGSMVLDGTVDVEAYSGANRDPRSVGARLAQGPAAEEVFDEFLEHCRLAGERCSLNAWPPRRSGTPHSAARSPSSASTPARFSRPPRTPRSPTARTGSRLGSDASAAGSVSSARRSACAIATPSPDRGRRRPTPPCS